MRKNYLYMSLLIAAAFSLSACGKNVNESEITEANVTIEDITESDVDDSEADVEEETEQMQEETGECLADSLRVSNSMADSYAADGLLNIPDFGITDYHAEDADVQAYLERYGCASNDFENALVVTSSYYISKKSAALANMPFDELTAVLCDYIIPNYKGTNFEYDAIEKTSDFSADGTEYYIVHMTHGGWDCSVRLKVEDDGTIKYAGDDYFFRYFAVGISNNYHSSYGEATETSIYADVFINKIQPDSFWYKSEELAGKCGSDVGENYDMVQREMLTAVEGDVNVAIYSLFRKGAPFDSDGNHIDDVKERKVFWDEISEVMTEKVAKRINEDYGDIEYQGKLKFYAFMLETDAEDNDGIIEAILNLSSNASLTTLTYLDLSDPGARNTLYIDHGFRMLNSNALSTKAE